jgi:hypothetical protein
MIEAMPSGGERTVKLGDNLDYGEAILSALRKEPNGSRGEVSVVWGGMGGHSLAYEVIKGKPVIFDTQSGKIYKKASDLKEFSPHISAAALTRLDDVDLDLDFLQRWVKSA